jgi:hypothetical protein
MIDPIGFSIFAQRLAAKLKLGQTVNQAGMTNEDVVELYPGLSDTCRAGVRAHPLLASLIVMIKGEQQPRLH